MRTALKLNARRERVLSSDSLPPPVGGWDAINALDAMPPDRAIQLENFFPGVAGVELRRGFNVHAVTPSATTVDTVMAYHAANTANDKLFAAIGSKIYEVTSEGPGNTSLSGLTSARFQTVNFRTTGGSYLFVVNGADAPRTFNGTSWSAPSISGTGLTNSNIINIGVHKKRLWFVPTNSTKAYYLNVDSIAGVATAFELGSIFSKGGSLWAIGTWSHESAGASPDDYIVFISSRGQAAIYAGTTPGSDFLLQAVLELGPPIGRRCLTKIGSDLAYISLDGVIPISQTLSKDRGAFSELEITKNIRDEMHEAARVHGSDFGWQLISYPKGTRAILNVPLSPGDLQHQYVMNTVTGAWCKFTGQNANCWEVYQDRLFFGGNDGIVYEADIALTDHGANLDATMRCAFNFLKSPGQKKKVLSITPIITLDQSITPSLAVDVDFDDSAVLNTAIAGAGTTGNWDEVNWDEFVWAEEQTTYKTRNSVVANPGRCVSIKMGVSISKIANEGRWGEAVWGSSTWDGGSGGAPPVFRVNGFYVTWEKGGFL
jgi:hypothetical protein